MKWILPGTVMCGVLGLLCATMTADAQNYSVLHTFSRATNNSSGITGVITNSDGISPAKGLAFSGNLLYGATFAGGTNGFGTIYTINYTNGAFNVIYTFPSGSYPANSFGINPNGGLVLSNGAVLYGATRLGGGAGNGVIFSMKTNGTATNILHTFSGLDSNNFNTDGANPYAGLLLSGTMLYGTTFNGGGAANGVVFSYNTGNKTFAVLHTFSAEQINALGYYTNSDGANPAAGLVISGTTLFGTTIVGGTNANGTIFSMSTNGSGFIVLHHFAADNNGTQPVSELCLSGGILFGLGGTVAYSLNTNGTGFTILHQFNSQVDGAAYSSPGFTLYGGTLYGVATCAGPFSHGETFSMLTNGTTFTDFHDFTLFGTYPSITNRDGAFPNGGLFLTNGVLYGTASGGGLYGNGAIFKVSPPVEIFSNKVSNQKFQFFFQTFGGLNYTVEQNTNLAKTNWITFTNFTGSGSVTQFTLPVTNTFPRLFLRVKQQ